MEQVQVAARLPGLMLFPRGIGGYHVWCKGMLLG
jgi:hypothetical protein